MLTVEVTSHGVNIFGFGIATHEAHASDVIAILTYKPFKGEYGEWRTYVLPKILAVTTGTMARTVGQIDGESHLVGNLLEHYACIDVLQHILLSLLSHCFCRGVIVAAIGFLLPSLREIAHALQITDDTGHVVNVL